MLCVPEILRANRHSHIAACCSHCTKVQTANAVGNNIPIMYSQPLTADQTTQGAIFQTVGDGKANTSEAVILSHHTNKSQPIVSIRCKKNTYINPLTPPPRPFYSPPSSFQCADITIRQAICFLS